MCTAVTYKTKDFYFGRTLDYECSFGEEVTVTPRNFKLSFRHMGIMEKHYAIVGMAHVEDGFPLYYDAANERGLCMAGLNFVGGAHYGEGDTDLKKVSYFELIPYILGRCESVAQARAEIERINIVGTPFSKDLPVSKLHWIIADRECAITVESVEEGVRVYDNPVGVLTNDPSFDKQLFSLNDYMSLSPCAPKNSFSEKLSLNAYSRGMGAIGLPGDVSSRSRFIRAAFVKLNSRAGDGEEESVGQFFHILGSVEQVRGCCEVDKGEFEITQYSSCCNADKGIYYYTTYGNRQINAVDMRACEIDSDALIRYPLVMGERINYQN
ncbi:MAG: choloylglycine hydrolase [Clostridia bacterium]|nr:choloylglycine hydrolase [Clostridia bacterium]